MKVPLNGDEIFLPMLQGIREAKQSITFETYIYWSGDIGRQFASALAEASKRSVKCHVLLDWVGSAKMDDVLIKELTAAGVQLRRFHPQHWSHLARLNNRTHRKLLVVDGHIGFTGRVGIATQWTGSAQDPAHWRDTHVRISGPAEQMQSVFVDNWIKVTGEALHGPAYFPPLTAQGKALAHMVSSSPSGGSESMHLMSLFSITAAATSIDLSAAHFVPDDLTVEALVGAMKRGVKVRITVPGAHIDAETVRSASPATWEPLLLARAAIAEYEPTMYHCKAMIVDGLLTSVGSTNFDNRSFQLTDEATLNLLDAEFAQQQTDVFNVNIGKSRVISFVVRANHPWTEKISEHWSRLLAPQL